MTKKLHKNKLEQKNNKDIIKTKEMEKLQNFVPWGSKVELKPLS